MLASFILMFSQRRPQTSVPHCTTCQDGRVRTWSWNAPSANPTSRCAGSRTASPSPPPTGSRSCVTATDTCCESWRPFLRMTPSTQLSCPTTRRALPTSASMVSVHLISTDLKKKSLCVCQFTNHFFPCHSASVNSQLT